MSKNNSNTLVNDLVKLENTLRNMTKHSPLGDQRTNLTNLLRANSIHHTKAPETDKNTHVKYFFTRPRINLSRANLKMDRKLAKLLKKKDSIYQYIRVLLDPMLGGKSSKIEGDTHSHVVTNLLPNEEPFMPLVSNSLHTASGFKDPILNTFVTKEGLMKEQVAYGDGTDRVYGAYDMSLTFTNYVGEGIYYLFDTWIRYISMVKIGDILPYSRYLLGRQVDYQTGVYVLVLAEDNRTIKHIGKTIAFPTAISTGKFFDINKDAVKRSDSSDVTVRFQMIGAEYDDPITAFEFNKHVATFVPGLRNYVLGDLSTSPYVKLPPDVAHRFNNYAIPFIDLSSSTLEWVVRKEMITTLKEEYEEIIKNYKG